MLLNVYSMMMMMDVINKCIKMFIMAWWIVDSNSGAISNIQSRLSHKRIGSIGAQNSSDSTTNPHSTHVSVVVPVSGFSTGEPKTCLCGPSCRLRSHELVIVRRRRSIMSKVKLYSHVPILVDAHLPASPWIFYLFSPSFVLHVVHIRHPILLLHPTFWKRTLPPIQLKWACYTLNLMGSWQRTISRTYNIMLFQVAFRGLGFDQWGNNSVSRSSAGNIDIVNLKCAFLLCSSIYLRSVKR